MKKGSLLESFSDVLRSNKYWRLLVLKFCERKYNRSTWLLDFTVFLVLAFDDVDTQTPTQPITPCDQTGVLNTIRGSRLPCTKITQFSSVF